MRVTSNRWWHAGEDMGKFHSCLLCLWRVPFTHFGTAVCFFFYFWMCISNVLCFAFLTLHPSSRFADSIRGMLKLILVLMLAGASLASTWFTLTCLSRVTHLPSTAGRSTRASQSRWHGNNSDTTQMCDVHLFRHVGQSILTRYGFDGCVKYNTSCLYLYNSLDWKYRSTRL